MSLQTFMILLLYITKNISESFLLLLSLQLQWVREASKRMSISDSWIKNGFELDIYKTILNDLIRTSSFSSLNLIGLQNIKARRLSVNLNQIFFLYLFMGFVMPLFGQDSVATGSQCKEIKRGVTWARWRPVMLLHSESFVEVWLCLMEVQPEEHCSCPA